MQLLICKYVYYCCAGDYSILVYEINRFKTFKLDENGEADIFEIFTNVYPTYSELQPLEVIDFFKKKDFKQTNRLSFKQYFKAINELEKYSYDTILRLNNNHESVKSDQSESNISSNTK